jgi:hypothetical protein
MKGTPGRRDTRDIRPIGPLRRFAISIRTTPPLESPRRACLTFNKERETSPTRKHSRNTPSQRLAGFAPLYSLTRATLRLLAVDSKIVPYPPRSRRRTFSLEEKYQERRQEEVSE